MTQDVRQVATFSGARSAEHVRDITERREKAQERWRSFGIDELLTRDEVSLGP